MSFTKLLKHGISSAKKFIPKTYQKTAIQFGISRPAAGFFLAPGLGKTMIILMVFRILRKLDLVDELLVVAKKHIIYDTWPNEIEKWAETNKLTTSILHGSKKSQNLWKQADVYLINFDGLTWLAKQKQWLRAPVRRMLAIDESSKLRHTNTRRFRAVRRIVPHFKRRYIATGTPTPKGLMGIFGQVYALDVGETFGSTIGNFRMEFFEPTGYKGHKWSLQLGARKRIYKKLKPLIIRYGTDQLDLPPITFIDRMVKLPPNARKAYDKMENDRLVKFKKGEITAVNAAVATVKLRQIANGALYHENRKEHGWEHIHDAKSEDLVELIEELQGEPALIAYEHLFEHEKLRSYFKAHAPSLYKESVFVAGKTKQRELDAYLRAWDRGDIPAMFGNSTIAYGLNLQGKGGIVIYYALTWNFEDYDQFYRRVWRQGQSRRVLVYRIVAKDTVDEDMVSVLANNEKDMNSLLRAMEKRHGVR